MLRRRILGFNTTRATVVCALTLGLQAGHSQSQRAIPQKFEVASVKRCGMDVPPNARSGGGSSSPGRLDIECQTVLGLIRTAYVVFADGRHLNRDPAPISGGPAWINSDRYTIEAKPDGPQSPEMMHGPMLQALLESRFHLKVHRETREIPVYALIVAKGGLKLKPFKEGSCTPIDFLNLQMHTLDSLSSGVRYCRNAFDEEGGIVTYEAQGTSMDEFSKIAFGGLDRPVTNKTGLKGLFDVHLEFAPERAGGAASPTDAAGVSIFTAVQQQLGLKLESAKGTGQFLIIDSVEMPSEN
jgi:uncharacterized protein (TIGR03435 family)